MDPAQKRLLRAIANYSGFNAERTLATGTDSEFTSTKFGGAIALADPARPKHPHYNRVLGLGPGDASRLGEILSHYKALRCTPHFDLGADALVPELIMELTGHGFEPQDALHYLTASPGSQQAKAIPAITVERWGNERADHFITLLKTSGVPCDDVVWEKRRGLYGTDDFRIFVATHDGEPAAWATSFVDRQNNTCYVANAYTAPEHRGHGCHRALLDARLADAHALGLKSALTDVVPDTVSARNLARAAFKPALTLTLWHR